MCYNGMGDGMLNESLLDKKKRYLVGVSESAWVYGAHQAGLPGWEWPESVYDLR